MQQFLKSGIISNCANMGKVFKKQVIEIHVQSDTMYAKHNFLEYAYLHETLLSAYSMSDVIVSALHKLTLLILKKTL